MLEQICRDDLRNMCREVIDKYKTPLVRLKMSTEGKRLNPYEDFISDPLSWFSVYSPWNRRKARISLDKSVVFFENRSPEICKAFVADAYGGNIEIAMDKTKDFEVLYHKFLMWFGDKRRDFRMDFTGESEKRVSRNSRSQNPHGGVANLLKVLTKTMEKQGADIRSIARVQYAICIQAGIYIPDEFIEDVAVALSVTEEKE